MSKEQDALIESLALYSNDPLGYVLWAFPWGEPGELEKLSGPQEWQRKVLIQVRDGILSLDKALQLATTSGHGVGKSALVAWLLLWAISTCENTKGVVTANTENQLKTKTWAEVAKWHRLCINKDMFKLTATALFSAEAAYEKTWRIDMVPWSERNTEAFAGLHNQGLRIIVIFDEASAIPDLIWEVTEGALTDKDTQIIWAVFGNPTRNTGRFRECHPGGLFAHRWISHKVDSRTVTFTNKAQIADWVADYGEDSDFVRIRVRGEFPRQDEASFISLELARASVGRAILPQNHAPIILGCDIARFGTNASVIYPRQGRDAHSIPPKVLYGSDTMQVAAEIASLWQRLEASYIFIDEGGVGGGVVDRLRQMRVPIMGVSFGSAPLGLNEINPHFKYANRRAEMWGALRDWLAEGAIRDKVDSLSLVGELVAPTYSFDGNDKIVLESKKDMLRRGIASPDLADALALTFAFPALSKFKWASTQPKMTEDYNPYDSERMYQ